MKPKEPIPHNYPMATLNRIFAVSSLVLLALVGGLVMYDYARGWKQFQVGFLRLQRDRIRQELRLAQEGEDAKKIAELNAQIAATERKIAANRDSFRKAQEILDEREGRHYAADQNYRFAKANLDAMRYEAEMAALQKAEGWDEKQKEYEDQVLAVAELKVKLEDAARSRDEAQASVDEWTKAIDDAEAEKKQMRAAIDSARKRLSAVETDARFVLLNMPMLDFVNPTLKVDQVVLNDLYIDMNFLRVPRVDRCMTCHRAIDKPGFESREEAKRLIDELEKKIGNFEISGDRVAETRQRIDALKKIASAPRNLANPYRTHPELDLFVGSASKHPLLQTGCTVCHLGLDRATEFSRAGHTPSTEEQRDRWISKWRWESQPFLESPMHSPRFYESSCLKCHASQIAVPRGPDITRATLTIELYGCHGCHKIANWRFEDLRKTGPDLRGIAEKTTPDWAYRWISDPISFRPTTRMPSFFYQRNMVGPTVDEAERAHNIQLQNAEITALVRYLFAHSTRRRWQGPPVPGDPARGEELVRSVGCLACHIVEETVKDADGKPRPARREDFPLERQFGFNLNGTGTKTNGAWLFNWLKDPRAYYHAAPMPDLRLSDQEASDIVAFLLGKRHDDFMESPLTPPDPKALRELLRTYFVTSLSERETAAKLDSMSIDDQLLLLGERSIEKYGCFGCHMIEGFENARPIGTELTTEGSKSLHLFDFGFVHSYEHDDGTEEHVEHHVDSWIYNKLRSPRVWDDHRAKTYQDKLKMPNFHFSPEEAETITSVIVGLTKEKVADSMLAALDSRNRRIEDGRKLVSQHNCRGCHVVAGYGRAIAETLDDPGLYPPDLTPEGQRVQSPWLFNFLKDPTVMTMRPWLAARMPTFHFTDEEASRLVDHFAAEGDVPAFDTNRQRAPDTRSAAIGSVAFRMMRCGQCHPSGGAIAPTVEKSSLAPDLRFARTRLRHDWIPDWISRPNEIMPGTKMPTNFPRDPSTSEFSSPLGMALGSAAFADARNELMPFYASEAELVAELSDVATVTEYLRDYIWSLGAPTMREAGPTEAPRVTPLPDTSVPPVDRMEPAVAVSVAGGGR